MNSIIAVVGMCGAGKSVLCDYLVKKGYKTVYFGGLTMEALKKAGLPINPENEKMMREKIRKDYGMGGFAVLSIPYIKEMLELGNVVIDGLYSWEELNVLKKEFDVKLVCVVTDKSLRYERLSKRKVRPFTPSEAKMRDISEIENLGKGGPISYADYYILNNGTIKDFEIRAEEILKSIKNA